LQLRYSVRAVAVVSTFMVEPKPGREVREDGERERGVNKNLRHKQSVDGYTSRAAYRSIALYMTLSYD